LSGPQLLCLANESAAIAAASADASTAAAAAVAWYCLPVPGFHPF